MHLADLEISKIKQNDAYYLKMMSAVSHVRFGPGEFELLASEFLLSMNRVTRATQERNAKLNYANVPYRDIIQAEPLNPTLNFRNTGGLLQVLSPYVLNNLLGNRNLQRATVLVDPYGQIQIAGTSDNSKGIIGLFPSVGNCLGIEIKDQKGNLTMDHRYPIQQYSNDTVLAAVDRHRSSFGDAKQILVSLSGVALEKGSLAAFARPRLPNLREIDRPSLEQRVINGNRGAQFSFEYFAGGVVAQGIDVESILLTDVLATNLAGAPTAANQYWVNNPFPI